MTKELECISCVIRLRELGTFSLEKGSSMGTSPMCTNA